MKRELNCLRCNEPMNYIETQKLQLGQTGWFLGDLPNLIAGAMKVDIYCCSACGKIEFFIADATQEDLPQKKCPKCGKLHDFDYPKCPFCKYRYEE